MNDEHAKDQPTPNEVRTFPLGRVEIFEIGGVRMSRSTFQPGWHWAEHARPVGETGSCHAHHVGIVISGSLEVRMDDGTQSVLHAGGAYDIPPGHDGRVVGDEPWITIDYIGPQT